MNAVVTWEHGVIAFLLAVLAVIAFFVVWFLRTVGPST